MSPRLPPLTAEEIRHLDELKGEWLDIHLTPPRCLDCSMALEGRVKELAGVKEVVAIHFRDHLAVRRDPVACPATDLAESIRAITHCPCTISPTKYVLLAVQNMTCSRCIGSIRGTLIRTDGVLSPDVQIGLARVIVSSGTRGEAVRLAIESAPGPSCKNVPAHVFKAQVVDEKDDAIWR